MDNKPNHTGIIIFNLLLVQYFIVVFLTIALFNSDMGVPYELWQLIGKIIVLTITIIFYYLYKRADNSKSWKVKYKICLIGFIIFSVEIGVFYGYLYLIGL